MKRLFATTFALLLCTLPALAQDTGIHRNDGPIVDALKAITAAYEAGNWDGWEKYISADAQFYINSTESITRETRLANAKAVVAELDSYGFNEPVYAHIQTAEGVDWGMLWGAWVGTAGEESTTVMVHVVSRFENGKIVEQYGFWDVPEQDPNLANN